VASGSRTGAFAVLLLAQLAVGAAAILARYALDAGLSPASLTAWRLTLASAVVLAARVPTWRSGAVLPPVPTRLRWRLLLAGAALGLHFAAWFASLRYVPVARSTLLVATGPIWTGLAECFVPARRPPRTFWLGLAVALPGALLVTLAPEHATPSVVLSKPAWMGDALAVLGAACIAAYLLLTRDAQTTLGTGRTVAWTYTAAAVAAWPAALLLGDDRPVVPQGTAAWLPVVGMALVPQLLGHTLLNLSLRRFSASAVAAATLLEPVFAAVLAWPLFGERVTPPQAVGAAVLLGGVGLALWRGRASAMAPAAPDMV
jgi:drug/metabolite transporter (DMT)-like permease